MDCEHEAVLVDQRGVDEDANLHGYCEDCHCEVWCSYSRGIWIRIDE